MRTILITLHLFMVNTIFAQLPQLRPEVIEFYQLRDIALRSRVLDEKDLIEKHKAFFSHPLFCEIAYGIEYIPFVRLLLLRGEYTKAEEYLLKAAKLHYFNTSNMLAHIFNKRTEVWFDSVLEKILEIENKRAIDPRIIAIAHELAEMVKKDRAVRMEEPIDRDFKHKIDSANIYRIIELIKENPDIDITRINMMGRISCPSNFNFTNMGDVGIILWHVLRCPVVPYAITAWTDFFEAYFRKRAEEGKGLDYCFWYDARIFWSNLVFAKREDPYYGIIGFGVPKFPLFIYVNNNLDEINKNRAKVGLLPLSRR